MLTHNLSGLKYYLNPNKKPILGVQKIWMSDIHNLSVNIKYEFKIYFADSPEKSKFYQGGSNIERIDIPWIKDYYPDGYFNK